MAQGKMKVKGNLPQKAANKAAQKKAAKAAAAKKGPPLKKGRMDIAPKKSRLVEQRKVGKAFDTMMRKSIEEHCREQVGGAATSLSKTGKKKDKNKK